MPNIKVEAVTPVHNRRELTVECLKSLLSVDLGGIDLSVTVVDDGSTDGTADAVRSAFPDIKIISGDGNLWYTAGMNLGIKAALANEPDYILGFNNDSIFDPKFLVSMIETAEKIDRSVVGAVLIDWEDKRSIFQVSPKWNVWWGGLRHWRKQSIDTLPDSPWEVPIIVGNCVLIPVDAIKAAGLMDEKRLPQFGDAGFTPKMKRLGWKLLIDPHAHVFCKPNDIPASFGQMSLTNKFKALFKDPFGPHGIKRRFYTNFFAAPNKLQGIVAFFIFYIRVLLGKNIEGRWGMEQNEEPIAKTFADKIIRR